MSAIRQRLWWMPFALIVAFMLSAIPLPAMISPFRPDWIALVMIYIAIFTPQRWVLTTAMVAGLLLDVLQGTLLGQHPLALMVCLYAPLKLHLRLTLVPIWQSMLATASALALYQFALFWCNGATGNELGLKAYLAPLVTGTLVWPLLLVGIDILRLERVNSD
ncbi:MAG: rod shape-determining protein MreD [Pseudomonadota bacterium]